MCDIKQGQTVRLKVDITLSVSLKKGQEVGVIAVLPATLTWKSTYLSDWIVMVMSPIGEYPVADHEIEVVQ